MSWGGQRGEVRRATVSRGELSGVRLQVSRWVEPNEKLVESPAEVR